MDVAGKTIARYGLLINPGAGSVEDAEILKKRVAGLLEESGSSVVAHVSLHENDLGSTAEKMVSGGCQSLIVAGGDGSINQVLPAVAGRSIPLGILPLGTVNLLAMESGIPWDAAAAVKIILAGKIKTFDAASANGRLFIQLVGAGFDAAILRKFRSRLHKKWRYISLPWIGFAALADAPSRRWKLACDGKEIEAAGRGVVIANGALYGGNFRLARDVANDDGILDLFVIPAWPVAELARFYAACAGADITSNMQHWKGSRFSVNCEGSAFVHADGEVCLHTPLEISVIPKAVSLFVP